MNYSEKRAKLLEDSTTAPAGASWETPSRDKVIDDLISAGLMPWMGPLKRKLHKLQCGFDAAINYNLPSFTFHDHLIDCFGWLTYDRHAMSDEFVEAFCGKLEESLPWLRSLRWRG